MHFSKALTLPTSSFLQSSFLRPLYSQTLSRFSTSSTLILILSVLQTTFCFYQLVCLSQACLFSSYERLAALSLVRRQICWFLRVISSRKCLISWRKVVSQVCDYLRLAASFQTDIIVRTHQIKQYILSIKSQNMLACCHPSIYQQDGEVCVDECHMLLISIWKQVGAMSISDALQQSGIRYRQEQGQDHQQTHLSVSSPIALTTSNYISLVIRQHRSISLSPGNQLTQELLKSHPCNHPTQSSSTWSQSESNLNHPTSQPTNPPPATAHPQIQTSWHISMLYRFQMQFRTNRPSFCLPAILLCLLLPLCSCVILFQTSSTFRTIQIKLTTTSGFISASSDNSFQFANQGFASIGSIGLALCGYDIPASPAIQFRAQGSYDEQSNSFIIVALAANTTTFYFLNYFLLVASTDAPSYLYIDNPCITSTFNISNPAYYNRTYVYNVTGPYTITSATTLTIVPYLRSLYSVANSTYNYYNLTSITYFNNYANVTAFLNYSLVSEVCLSILYFNQALASAANIFLNVSSSQTLSLSAATTSLTLATVSQQNFTINSIYGPSYVPKCVVGIRAAKWLAASRQTLSFNMSGSGIYDLITSNTYEVNYNWFCAADIKCPSTAYQYYPIINECEPACTIANCSVCSTSTSCQTCQPGFYLSVLYRCLACVPNCQNCTNATNCLVCFNGYYYNPTAVSCSACSLYCNTCTYSQCSSCQTGYFASSTSCIQCSSIMAGCLLCSSANYCNSCPNGTYFNGSACQNCSVRSLGCVSCSSTICFGCGTGYFLGGYTCNPCTISQSQCCSFFVANCTTCQNTTACKTCQIGFYLSPTSTCLNCSQALLNCQTCSDNSTCTTCISGYVLSNAGCYSCSTSLPYCLTCQNISYCLVCAAPYIVVTGVCYNCPYWPTNQLYYLDAFNNCISCTNVTPNCINCNASNTCTLCNSLYYLSANTCLLCSQAILNCLSCVTATLCSICVNGYYLNPNTQGSCSQCNAQIAYCLSCSSTYFNAINSWVVSCSKCQPEYFINSTICSACIDAIPFCLMCVNSFQCKQCASYYYLSSTLTCINCATLMPGCITCNSSQCLSCLLGYYLINGYCTLCSMAINYCNQCSTLNANITCQQCLPGYYLTAQFTCLPCNSTLPFCTNCLNSLSCVACLPGYASSLTNSSCYPCQTLIPNCLYCNSDLSCQKCLQNYLLDYNGECQSCDTSIYGCDKCAMVLDSTNTSTLNCTACASGYLSYLANNFTKCIACNVSIFYCSACLDLTHCKICVNTSFLNDKGTCSLCSLYLTNCLYCNNNSVCITCAPGYYSSNSVCQPCDPAQFGITANQLPVCNQCKYVNAVAVCLSCQVGYYSQNNSCSLCSTALPFCANCQISTLCDSCISGYYLSQNWQCLPCDPSLVNCSVCSSDGICLQCQTSFFLNTTLNQCFRCNTVISGCLTCTSNSTCLSCQDGYYLSLGSCALCSTALENCAYCYNSSYCALKVASASNSPPITTLKWYVYFIIILIIIALVVAGAIWWRKANPPPEQKFLERTGHTISDTQRELIQQHKDEAVTAVVDEIKVEDKLCLGCKRKTPVWMNLQLVCKECELKAGKGNKHKIKQEFKKKGNKPENRVKSPLKQELHFQEIEIIPPQPSQLQQKVQDSQPAHSILRQKHSLDILIQPLSNQTNNLEIYSKIEPQRKNMRSEPHQMERQRDRSQPMEKGANRMKSQFD